MIVQCARCKRVKIDGRWVRIKCVALTSATVTHGICPLCAGRLEREESERAG